MRTALLRLAAAVITLALPFAGCGGAGGLLGFGFPRVADTYVLPFTPGFAGEGHDLVLANFANEDAPVYVGLWGPNAMGLIGGEPIGMPQGFFVPANGTVRIPSSQFLGAFGSGGYWMVDTRDVTTLDPVTGEPESIRTTGYVVPWLDQEFSGALRRGGVLQGLVPTHRPVSVGVNPLTIDATIVNSSYSQNPGGVVPESLLVRVRQYDFAGVEVSSTDVLLPPFGKHTFTPVLEFGIVEVEVVDPVPLGVIPRISLASREEAGLAHAALRSLRHVGDDDDDDDLIDAGFFAEWGLDPFGNRHDFCVVASNPTNTVQTALLREIYRDNNQILIQPRIVSVGPHRSVLLGTTNADSLGLGLGESSPLADLFGDPLATSISHRVAIRGNFSSRLSFSVRTFDPSFGSYYTIESGFRRSTLSAAVDFPVEPTLGSGRRNELPFLSSLNQDTTVQRRVITPGGREHILDPIVIAGLTQGVTTLDGQAFREDPNDLLQPPLGRVRWLALPPVGLTFGARTIERNAQGLILLVRPQIMHTHDD